MIAVDILGYTPADDWSLQLRSAIEAIVQRIAADPDRCTNSFSRGSRLWDGCCMADGDSHYVQVHFDFVPEVRPLRILTVRVMPMPGPH